MIPLLSCFSGNMPFLTLNESYPFIATWSISAQTEPEPLSHDFMVYHFQIYLTVWFGLDDY